MNTIKRKELMLKMWQNLEYRKHMSEAHKGQVPTNIAQLVKLNTGKGNVNWKGAKVGYHGLHMWVRRVLGIPRECVYCGVRDLKRVDGRSAIQYANISHTYKRNLTDWIPLCISCHHNYDKTLRNLTA